LDTAVSDKRKKKVSGKPRMGTDWEKTDKNFSKELRSWRGLR
jgi:hypothetical protein